MTQRSGVFRIQTLTKSEYTSLKNIPEAVAKKKPIPEKNDQLNPILTTPLPLDLVSEYQDEGQYDYGDPFQDDNGNSVFKKKAFMSHQKSKKKRYDSNQDHDAMFFRSEPKRYQGRSSYSPSKDFESKFIELNEERNTLDMRLRQVQRMNASLEEDLHRMKDVLDDQRSQIEAGNTDKVILEEELRKAKIAKKNLEKELMRNTDEKSSLTFEYENLVSTLKNKLSSLKINDEPNGSNQNFVLSQTQEQNAKLLQEIMSIKKEKSLLEKQLEQLKDQNRRIVTQSLENLSVQEQEKLASEHFKKTLQQKIDELALRDKDHSEIVQYKSLTHYDLNTILQNQGEDLRGSVALLLAEIDRLNQALADKDKKNGGISGIYNEIPDSGKRLNLSSDRLNAGQNSDLDAEVRSLRRILAENEVKMKFLINELQKANQKAPLTIQLNDSQWDYFGENNKNEGFNLESPNNAEKAKKAVFRGSEMPSSLRGSANNTNLDVAFGNLMVKLAEHEQKEILFMIEIERLGEVLSSSKVELNFWKGKALDNSSVSQLEEEKRKTSAAFEIEKRSLELQILGYKTKAQEFENLLKILKQENESLQQANLDQAKSSGDWQNKYNQLENKLNLKFDQFVEKSTTEKALIATELNRNIAQNEELQIKNKLLNTEKDRLVEINNSLIVQMDSLKGKIQDLSQDMKQSETRYANEMRNNIDQANLKFAKEKNEVESLLLKTQARYQELQLQNVMFMIEVERLQGIIKEREQEFQEWNTNLQYLTSENVTLKQKLESQTQLDQNWQTERNSLEAHISDLNKKIMGLESFMSQNQDLQAQLKAKNLELIQLQSKISELQVDRDSSEKIRIELVQAREMMRDYQTKLILSQEESKRHAFEIKEKQKEIEELKTRYNYLEKKSESVRTEIREEFEILKKAEIREATQKADLLYQDKMILENQIKELNKKVNEYQRELPSLGNEIERLTNLNRQREGELQVWKDRALSIEQAKDREIQLLKQDIDASGRVTMDLELRRLNEKFNMERYEYEAIIKGLKKQVSDLENSRILANSEYQSLNMRYNENLKEIERARQAENKLISKSSDYELRLRAEKNLYETEFARLKEMTRRLETKLDEMTRENSSLEAKYHESVRISESLKNRMTIVENDFQEGSRNLKEQLKRSPNNSWGNNRNYPETGNIELREKLKVYREESEDLERSLHHEKNENQNLKQALYGTRGELMQKDQHYKDLEAEYLILKRKYEQLYVEAEELQRSRDLYKSQSETNRSDIGKKHRELVAKIQEVDELKTRYEQALARVDPVVAGTSKIITRISITKDSK